MEEIPSGHGSGLSPERRRVPRLHLTQEQFRLDANGKVFSVLDLSMGGMGIKIIDGADHVFFTMGASFSGMLKLREKKVRLHAVARHVRKDMVGAEFETLPDESLHALKEALDPGCIGRGMRPFPCPDGRATWYHGTSGADFLVWRGLDGARTRLGLFLLGSFVQWEETEGLTTGQTLAGEDPLEGRGVIGFETLLLEKDEKPDPEKLRLVRALLLQVSCPEELRDWSLRKVSG